MSSATEWATIGRVVAPFGIHGELKVRSLTDIPARFSTVGNVYLGPQHIPHAIEAARPYKGDIMIVKLAGMNDMNAAEVVRGWELSIPLDELAELPPGSYYQHDILGLRVATLDGRVIGEIVDIMETGSNDVYIIKTKTSGQILIPAIKEIIKRIDLNNRMMYIEPIGGMLDDNAVVADQDEQEQEEVLDTPTSHDVLTSTYGQEVGEEDDKE